MNPKIIYSSIFSLKDSHHSPFYFILHYYLCRDTNSVYGIVTIFQNQDFLGCSSTKYRADHYRTARNQFHHIFYLFVYLSYTAWIETRLSTFTQRFFLNASSETALYWPWRIATSQGLMMTYWGLH